MSKCKHKRIVRHVDTFECLDCGGKAKVVLNEDG